MIRKFLIDVLGLDDKAASANACRMEHAVDEATLQRLGQFALFIHDCPRAGDDYLVRSGLKEGDSKENVLSWLREQGLTPVSVKSIVTGKGQKRLAQRLRRVSSSDLGSFCWQLSTMLEGGLSITSAVVTIADDMENKYFSFVMFDRIYCCS